MILPSSMATRRRRTLRTIQIFPRSRRYRELLAVNLKKGLVRSKRWMVKSTTTIKRGSLLGLKVMASPPLMTRTMKITTALMVLLKSTFHLTNIHCPQLNAATKLAAGTNATLKASSMMFTFTTFHPILGLFMRMTMTYAPAVSTCRTIDGHFHHRKCHVGS